MMKTDPQPVESPDQSPSRSDRLLQAMKKVCNHDLPNQMVALQSLLQLFEFEKSASLDADGREYLARLNSATQRASDLVRFLKELCRFNVYVPRRDTVSFEALARELQGELQRRCPQARFQFLWEWHVESVIGDERAYLQALAELILGILPANVEECLVKGTSDQTEYGLELVMELAPLALSSAFDAPQPTDQTTTLILGREWLALTGAAVEVAPNSRFVITIPNG